MYAVLKELLISLEKNFDSIPVARKELLEIFAKYIQQKHDQKETMQLLYVCTHNSRRSHFGQIAAALAAAFYQIENVHTFSGGTEVNALHPNATHTLKGVGLQVVIKEDGVNPKYIVSFGESKQLLCFSKLYHDTTNPTSNFVAIMTCSDAETNCPFIPGAELRIGTTYDDPKIADGTPIEAAVYRERFLQILTETLFAFSLVS
jgi:protein-tyrosine phosphatase/arsenate reductase